MPCVTGNCRDTLYCMRNLQDNDNTPLVTNVSDSVTAVNEWNHCGVIDFPRIYLSIFVYLRNVTLSIHCWNNCFIPYSIKYALQYIITIKTSFREFAKRFRKTRFFIMTIERRCIKVLFEVPARTKHVESTYIIKGHCLTTYNIRICVTTSKHYK